MRAHGCTAASIAAVLLAIAWKASTAQGEMVPPNPTVTVGAPTPDSLARLVVARFAAGSPESFDSVYGDPLGRGLIYSSSQRHSLRRAELARVLAADSERAVLLLT